jgi:hypothetical protein
MYCHFQPEPGQMLPNLDTETDIHVQSDDFVAAIYDNRWFIGKIEEIDNTDNEILVNFMVTCCKTSSFKWSTKRDEIWICQNFIVSIVNLFNFVYEPFVIIYGGNEVIRLHVYRFQCRD